MVRTEVDGEKLLTEAEFDAVEHVDKIGVSHTDRVKFLQDNGYDLTRSNMMDSSLSARSTLGA